MRILILRAGQFTSSPSIPGPRLATFNGSAVHSSQHAACMLGDKNDLTL